MGSTARHLGGLHADPPPFTGTVGFTVCWYAVFVAFYAGLTALTPQPRRIVIDRVVAAIVMAAPALVGLAPAEHRRHHGLEGPLHWATSTSSPTTWPGARRGTRSPWGGIAHRDPRHGHRGPIAVVIAMPLGLATAIYISRSAGRARSWSGTVVEAMTALPSIVAGLFIYTIWIVNLGMETSGLAASSRSR